jgi:hypothetical protein
MIRTTTGMAIALAGAALLAADQASAQTFSYDCDTPAEHYSELELTGPGRLLSVSGSVAAINFYHSSKYAPGAAAALSSADGHWSVTLRLAGVSGTDALLWKLLIVRDGKREDERQLAVTRIGEASPFALSLAPDGSGTATLGGTSYAFNLAGHAPMTARVSCSTGNFHFTALAFGG